MKKTDVELTSSRWILLICALAILSWFSLTQARSLIDPDEGRYAEIPREMVAGGDWVTPRLMGLRYFEKPGLQYWLTALTYSALGISNFTARLWPVLAGLLGIGWIGFVAARLYDRRTGFYAALITASSVVYFVAAHMLTLDMSLSLFMMLGVGCFALAQSARANLRACRNWMLLGWLALAAAVLSKGLVGIVLPAGAVGLYMLWARDWQLWRYLHLLKGAALFLALTMPWFVWVSVLNDEFVEFFFIREHFDRYTSEIHGRQGPIYYFVPVLLLGIFPWLTCILRGCVDSVRHPRLPKGSKEFNATRFFQCFIVVVFVFYSISSSKLPLYIVPIVPFLAIIGAIRLANAGWSKTDGWLMIAVALVSVAAYGYRAEFVSTTVPLAMVEGLAIWVLIAAGVWLLAGIVALLAPVRTDFRVACIALLAIVALQLTLWSVQAIAPSRSAFTVAELIKRHPAVADAPLYLVGLASPSLAFYLQRVPLMVGYAGELSLGMELEPDKVLTSSAAMKAVWSEHESAVAVVANKHYPYYAEVFEPTTDVCRDSRRTIVFKSVVGFSAQGCGDFEHIKRTDLVDSDTNTPEELEQ